MKILLTGATGYIGKRLLPLLLRQGHEVVCAVRDPTRLPLAQLFPGQAVSSLAVDFLEPPSAVQQAAVQDVEAAYFLIHSMGDAIHSFGDLEAAVAQNFLALLKGSRVRQIIYLGGITNAPSLSAHLESRQHVDHILRRGAVPVTTLKAGIVVGAGSASFEIIRDLVEKLPVMITPRWLNTRSQPIAVHNVLQYLCGVLGREETFGQAYDLAGPEVLTYREMLLKFAQARGLKRWIWTLPVMTPRLSSYWLYFVTATSYKLAVNLVSSMKIELIAQPNDLAEKLAIAPIPYARAVELALQEVDSNDVMSSWKDSLASSATQGSLLAQTRVPTQGCFVDQRECTFTQPVEQVLANIWAIGGSRGWYYGDALWAMRGWLDKLVGGVGLRRGRRSNTEIRAGDAVDFWRVLVADRNAMRLLLYAEMKLPGEAWLEFRIERPAQGAALLRQTATFRPQGLAGRLYWYLVLPFHGFIFSGMLRNVVRYRG